MTSAENTQIRWPEDLVHFTVSIAVAFLEDVGEARAANYATDTLRRQLAEWYLEHPPK